MGKFKQFLHEQKEQMQKTKVFYHNDMDGYGSAYAAYQRLGDIAQYISIDHGESPKIEKGDIVYFLDFSLKRPEMMELLKTAKKIIVIDHHASAQKELERKDNPENFDVHFDMTKSGAVLSWEYFQTAPIPDVLLYIQDSDLFKFKLKNSEAVACWFKKNIFEDKSKTFMDLGNLPKMELIVKEGSVILKAENEEIKKALESKYTVQFEGFKVGVVDYNKYASKIGNALAKEFDFGIVRSTDFNDCSKYAYQLRSVGKFDVSVIATKHGGGGHPNASGFSLPKSKEIWHKNN